MRPARLACPRVRVLRPLERRRPCTAISSPPRPMRRTTSRASRSVDAGRVWSSDDARRKLSLGPVVRAAAAIGLGGVLGVHDDGSLGVACLLEMCREFGRDLGRSESPYTASSRAPMR